MRAGGMRNELKIERKVRVGKTAAGEDVVVWQTWREGILCEVEVRRGKEQFDPTTKQRYSEEVYRFRTRWVEVEGLDTRMRLIDEAGAVYDIKALLPDQQRRADAIIEATVQNATIGNKALMLELLKTIPLFSNGVASAGFAVSADGGIQPYAFAVHAGALPAGLSLNSSTGTIAGTPSAPGSSAVTLKVTDAEGTVAILPEITLTVSA